MKKFLKWLLSLIRRNKAPANAYLSPAGQAYWFIAGDYYTQPT
jgi:hypothetical protein